MNISLPALRSKINFNSFLSTASNGVNKISNFMKEKGTHLLYLASLGYCLRNTPVGTLIAQTTGTLIAQTTLACYCKQKSNDFITNKTPTKTKTPTHTKVYYVVYTIGTLVREFHPQIIPHQSFLGRFIFAPTPYNAGSTLANLFI